MSSSTSAIADRFPLTDCSRLREYSQKGGRRAEGSRLREYSQEGGRRAEGTGKRSRRWW